MYNQQFPAQTNSQLFPSQPNQQLPSFQQQPSQSWYSTSTPPPSSNITSVEGNAGKKKQDRWSETEESILIELYGKRQKELAYKSYNSKEWEEVSVELRRRAAKQNVVSDKDPKKCKTKFANLTKKYKKSKDNLNKTGYGKGGRNSEDDDCDVNEREEMFPKHFAEMDEIFGTRDSVQPRLIVESDSSVAPSVSDEVISNAPKSSPEKSSDEESDINEASTLASFRRRRNDESEAPPESDFDDNTSLPNPQNRKRVKPDKGKGKAKTKKTKKQDDENKVLEFLEKAQEKEEKMFHHMMEFEKQQQHQQQKFAMDALSLLAGALKDIGKQ